MEKTINTLTLGLWLWIALAVYSVLFSSNAHPTFTVSAITNATVFLVGRIVVRQLGNLKVDVSVTGKEVIKSDA